MESTQSSAPSGTAPPAPKSDCLSPIIFIVLMGWVVSISYIRHYVIFSSTIDPSPTIRWVALGGALVQIVLLGLPLLPLALLWPNRRYRAVFQAWLLAVALISFNLPVHIPDPSAAQTQAVLHSFLLLIFCFLMIILARRRSIQAMEGQHASQLSEHLLQDPDSSIRNDYAQNRPFQEPRQRTNLWLAALLIASISAYPWLAWGALGSVLDILLQLLVALLFGLAAILLVELFIFQPLRQRPTTLWGDYFLGGLGACNALLVLASAMAFGFSSMQVLLMLVLPGLGWILIALKLLSPPENEYQASRRPNGWAVARRNLPLGVLIGLVAAAPMTLIDPDELVLVASSAAGEILGKAYQAALISTFVILAFGFLLLLYLLLRRSQPERPISSPERFSWASTTLGSTTLAAIGIAALIYFTTGQTGLYGERMFVILKDQANVSAAVDIADYDARRLYVYNTLVQHADETQADLRRWLDYLGAPYTPYYLVNAIEVSGNPALRLYLLTRPEVDRILDSPRMRPLPAQRPIGSGWESAPSAPQWNLTNIGAGRVWEEFGVTGAGIIVGQSDTGAQSDHPELANTYRGKDGDHDYNWFDPWNNTSAPIDIGGHGTHTLGNILGEHTGVAPGATWYACVNLARNLGNPALYLDCMQFMLAPFPLGGDPFIDGDPTRGAHVINNSWGCPQIEGCDSGTFLYAVRSLRAAGVFVVAGAGNDGPACDTLNTPPPIYDEVFAVGAVDRYGDLASFSSIGPVTADGSGRVKPDIVAPGVDVLSSLPGSSYGSSSGTSMAGPHVVGVVALMWSANPKLTGDIDRTEQILIQTAQPYTGRVPNCPGTDEIPSTAYGYGVLNAYQAVKMALGK